VTILLYVVAYLIAGVLVGGLSAKFKAPWCYDAYGGDCTPIVALLWPISLCYAAVGLVVLVLYGLCLAFEKLFSLLKVHS
jgi:hypothetical protein